MEVSMHDSIGEAATAHGRESVVPAACKGGKRGSIASRWVRFLNNDRRVRLNNGLQQDDYR